MIHLVTFSTADMDRSRELCDASSRRYGVEASWPWDLPMLQDTEFYRVNKTLLDTPRGCGFWAWKPYIILRAMGDSLCKNGDTLIYADAGIEFVNNVSHIIDRMDQDIFLFGNNYEHAHWCKRDIVETIWPAEEEQPVSDVNRLPDYNDWLTWSRFGKQVQASVIFFRVSDYSRSFVAEWLKWCLHRIRYSTICTDEWRYLIDDSPSIAPNHPEFQENRHDQAILTTMAYREGIKLHYWPAVYNLGHPLPRGGFTYERGNYPDEGYPTLFHHHRRRNHEWSNAA